MRPSQASDDEIRTALATRPQWERTGDAIRRTVECATFPDAIALVVRVGFHAEAIDHHPDIDVRYRNVTFVLSTHDVGGLTTLDFELAARIDAAVGGART